MRVFTFPCDLKSELLGLYYLATAHAGHGTGSSVRWRGIDHPHPLPDNFLYRVAACSAPFRTLGA